MKKNEDQVTRHDRLEQMSRMPAERLERRAMQFGRFTNRKGLPGTYGVGKERIKFPPLTR